MGVQVGGIGLINIPSGAIETKERI